jgi:hypothetical protein
MQKSLNKLWRLNWKWLVGWRIGLFLVSVLAAQWLPYRREFEYTSLAHENPWLLKSGWQFLTSWANFDGVLYLHNSTDSLLREPRFLPFFSLLIKAFSFDWLFQTSVYWQVLVGLVISHAAFGISLFFLYQIWKLDFSEKIARRAAGFLLVFPTSFFLVSVYSESLFLLLAVLAMWLARKRSWWWSFGCIGLAAVTRLPGILLIIPVGWEWTRWCWQSKKPVISRKTAGLISLALLPLILLMISHSRVYADPLKFIQAQGELANGRSTSGIVAPMVMIWRYLKILFTVSPQVYEWWVALLELGSGALAAVTIWFSFKLKFPALYQLYSLAMIFLPFASGTLSGFPRYLIIVFPLYIVLAHLTQTWRWIAMIGFLLLQVLLVSLFIRGYFVA